MVDLHDFKEHKKLVLSLIYFFLQETGNFVYFQSTYGVVHTYFEVHHCREFDSDYPINRPLSEEAEWTSPFLQKGYRVLH